MASNFSEQDIECVICGYQFDDSVRVPKRLNCPHTLCIVCVKQILKPNRSLRCPLCNKDQKINVKELATDLATLRLLEVMKYFGVLDENFTTGDEEQDDTKPLINVSESPRELLIITPSSSSEFGGSISKDVYCGKPIDYESRGLIKMRFKDGHLMSKFQCLVDICHISGKLYILDTRFARKETYFHILEPTLNEAAVIHDGFQLQGMETGCHGVTSINDHTIAVTNNECHQILIYTTRGELLSRFGTYGKGDCHFRDPRGICYRNGKLYITDCLNNCISIWTVNGKFLSKITEEDVIKYPMKILLNFKGELIVVCCNEYIVVYTADGTYKTCITHADDRKLEEIRCIHMDNCGNLLVTSREVDDRSRRKNTTWCIDVFDTELQYVRRIRDQQKQLKFISALTTARTDDNDDVIVIGDSGKGAVYFF